MCNLPPHIGLKRMKNTRDAIPLKYNGNGIMYMRTQLRIIIVILLDHNKIINKKEV